MRIVVGLLTIALATCLAACRDARPDLKRLYQTAGMRDQQPPVILVHGILRAKLGTDDKEYWPDSFWQVLFSDYPELALAFDQETLQPEPSPLRPTSITDQAAGRDFYGAAIRTLSDAGGYVSAEPGDAVDPTQRYYYVFLYDWRQDNAVTSKKFDRFLQQIRQDYDRPDLRVDVIAHSMGGLMLRYFFRYGSEDVLADNDFPVNNNGAKKVRRAVLLGTPNLGSVSALQAMIDGVPVGFGTIAPEVLATMPSVYQLLPHPINDWIIDIEGQPLQRDLFDVQLWRRFEWSIFNPTIRARLTQHLSDPQETQAFLTRFESYFEHHIERARRFVWSLSVPLEQVEVRHIVFGGDCDLTPARVLVEEVNGSSEIRLWPRDIAQPNPTIDYQTVMLEPGDGTVTKASLLAKDTLDPTRPRHEYSFFPLDYSFFLCVDHAALTSNIHFQDNLLHLLLSVDEV